MDKDLTNILNYLNKNGVFGEIDETDDFIIVHILWGDWKHEHAYCDYLMEKKGYKLVREKVTEQNGSDCYSSAHLYLKPNITEI